MQREMPSGVDYISDLPESIMETILTKMPLRDAVRTSILSSKWRYKWATLTHLEFNDYCVSETEDGSLANFINRFLLLHNGPINKFVLDSHDLESSSDIDQWLLFLSRKDVKELVLHLYEGLFENWYTTPSCLFTFQNLVSLELRKLVLNPPLSFKGFSFLKHLVFNGSVIVPNVLENFISSCPLLETLNFTNYDGLELTIRAPNLKDLILEGYIKDICLENTPKLVSITVDILDEYIGQSSSCNFDKFFGGVQSLQKLIGWSLFTKETTPLVMKYQQLKVIELSIVNFENMKVIKMVLRLVLNSPNLQQLQILSWLDETETDSSDLDFWEKECQFDCTFDLLKTVEMTNMSGVPHEVKFIGFLLANSPVLETISITPSWYKTG